MPKNKIHKFELFSTCEGDKKIKLCSLNFNGLMTSNWKKVTCKRCLKLKHAKK